MKENKDQGNKSRPNLGLVCMTADTTIRFREITRTRLLRLPEPDQKAVLREVYHHNISHLRQAIEFCKDNEINLYRIYSSTFPFSDIELGQILLEQLSTELLEIGLRAKLYGIRLVSHPDQFVVLNSDRPDVVENSVRVLQAHANLFDLLDQPRSPWAACNIHPGKAGREERLIKNLIDLPECIRSRLTLENDEYSYSAQQTYEICLTASVPMVFDAHHHVIHEKCDSYNHASVPEMFAKARETWRPNESWQLVHISNGQASFHDRKHHDFISAVPDCFRYAEWIEVEAKKKELAIEKLHAVLIGPGIA